MGKRKFTLSSVAWKDSAKAAKTPEQSVQNQKRNEPKASELTTIERGKPSRRTTAPIIVCIYKVTDNANDVWNGSPQDCALFQIQLEHDCRRENISFN